MKKQKFYWQPELASTIIYWSCTFCILFISLILALENNGPYLISNLVMVPFFVFAYLGIARSFNMTETSLIVRDVLWFRKKALPFSQIEKVTYNEKSIEIFSSEFKEGSKVFLMKKKTIPLFLEALKVKKPELKVAEDHSLGLHKKEEKTRVSHKSKRLVTHSQNLKRIS